jgi:1-aminocyclopropane-1-carboxylate deaminase/D-cysteine desulfhydrase-like pyridoxal-dependent ACC family enzyme
MPNLTVVDLSLDELTPYYKNPRRGNIPVIADSLRVNGQYKPIVVNRGTLTGRGFEILAGNHTFAAAGTLGWESIEATLVDVDDAGAARIVAADNRTSDLGSYDDEALADLLRELGDLEGTGYTEHDLLTLLSEPAGSAGVERLADRFGAPPLSVLSARGGDWAERKRLWTGLGIHSELGRDDELVYDSPQTKYANWYEVKNAVEAEAGHKLTDKEVLAHPRARLLRPVGTGKGTSVFDPSLTELIYAWYSAPGHRVIDPWAGGSVRGVVAAVLGREYTGIELRPEQIEANRLQLRVIGAAVRAGIGVGGEVPEWLGGEAGAVLEALPSESFDFAFSAPPKFPVAADLISDPEALTPVEEHGNVLVKRDDLFGLGSSRGGKVRSCLALAREAQAAGFTTLVTAGSRQSPQVNIVAEIAASLGMQASVHVPSGALTPELEAAAAAGAVVHQHAYGRNSVIVARAHEEVAGDEKAFEIPFGMETQKAIVWTGRQVENIPADVERIVVPVGSGMSLAGILHGLVIAGRDIPVLGVVVGSDPRKRLAKWAPAGWERMVQLVESGLDYHDAVRDNRLGNLLLDPIYEAKALRFLSAGDLLWVVGIRGTLADGPVLNDVTEPEWIEGESAEQLRELDAASYDLAFGCPPYYSLEKYSDDPRDLSNLTTAGFNEQMKRNIAEVARVLREDSFAVFVVGNVRDKGGYVLDMRRCMSEAAEAAGLRLVNDAVLLTPVGSAAPRAARGFKGTRTLTRVHQEVLVYVKGDRKRAAARCGEVEPLALAAVEVDDA